MQRYRSGHNGADSKSVCRKLHEGSNPSRCATSSRTSYRSRRHFFQKCHLSLTPSLLLSKSDPLRWAPIWADKSHLFCQRKARRSKLHIACSGFFSKVRARSLRCSSFPNRTRCAGLRFGFGKSLNAGIYFVWVLHIERSSRNWTLLNIKEPSKGCSFAASKGLSVPVERPHGRSFSTIRPCPPDSQWLFRRRAPYAPLREMPMRQRRPIRL